MLGITGSAVCYIKNTQAPITRIKQPVARVFQPRAQIDQQRVDAIAGMYRTGQTLEQIGSVYGITRERVRQILRRSGVPPRAGGRNLITERRRTAAAQRRDEKSMVLHGCTHSQYQQLQALQHAAESHGRGPIGAYRQQRNSALSRGVDFRLSLWQWWTIWQESGHWGERGRGRDSYCMARNADQGAYEVGNVQIIRTLDNIADGYKTTPAADRAARRGCIRDENGMTPREREVFPFVQQGLTAKQIAAHLGISSVTASQYKLNLRKRYLDAVR